MQLHDMGPRLTGHRPEGSYCCSESYQVLRPFTKATSLSFALRVNAQCTLINCNPFATIGKIYSHEEWSGGYLIIVG